jgi:hypothetical protein
MQQCVKRAGSAPPGFDIGRRMSRFPGMKKCRPRPTKSLQRHSNSDRANSPHVRVERDSGICVARGLYELWGRSPYTRMFVARTSY